MNKILTVVFIFSFLEAFGSQNEKHVRFVGVENEETNNLTEINGRPVTFKKQKRLPYKIPTEAELKEGDFGYIPLLDRNKKFDVSEEIIMQNREFFWGNVTLNEIANEEFKRILQNPHFENNFDESNMEVYDDLILSYRGNRDAAGHLAIQEKDQRLRIFWKYAENLIRGGRVSREPKMEVVRVIKTGDENIPLIEVVRKVAAPKKKRRLPYKIPTEAELKKNDMGYCWMSASTIKADVPIDVIETNRLIFWGNFILDEIATKEFEKILQDHNFENSLDIYDDLILSYRGDKKAAMHLRLQEKDQKLRLFWKYAENLIRGGK